MRVSLVGGAGKMGRCAARLLVHHKNVDLRVADVDASTAAQLAEDLDAQWTALDATDPEAIEAEVAHANVVLNSTADVRLNLAILDACISCGTDYVDLGGLYHVTRDELQRSDAAERSGVACITCCGVSPGLTNLMASSIAKRIGPLHTIRVRAGLTSDGTAFGYSLRTIVDELTAPPVVFLEGEWSETKVRSGRERIAFPGIGPLTTTWTLHSEVATFPLRHPEARAVDFKVGFPDGPLDDFDTFARYGLLDTDPVAADSTSVRPRAVVEGCLANLDSTEGDDTICVYVDAEGKNGTGREAIVASRPGGWPYSAVGLATAAPAVAALHHLSKGDVPPGVHLPEDVFEPTSFFEELTSYDIHVRAE